MDAGDDDAVLRGPRARGLAAGLAALCDVLAASGLAFILAFPHAGLAARLPALLAGGYGSGSGSSGVPLLAARAFAEACEAAPQWPRDSRDTVPSTRRSPSPPADP